jgi:hypothetical protein
MIVAGGTQKFVKEFSIFFRSFVFAQCFLINHNLAPEPVLEHEKKSVLAALRMIKVVEAVSKDHGNLAVRIGIHTGDVCAGLIGEERCLFGMYSSTLAIYPSVFTVFKNTP